MADGPKRTDVDGKILVGKELAKRLRRELRLGHEAWAHWEALNGKSADDRREFQAAISNLGLGLQFEAIRRILARDAILVLYRMTDPPSEDRQTLCSLSGIIDDARVRERMTSRDWLIQDGWHEFLVEGELKERPFRFDKIRLRVPPKWGKAPPKRPAVYTLRNKLRPVRDRVLAHIMDDTLINHARVREIRALMKIISGLVAEADLLFSGHSNEGQWGVKLAEANRLWDYLSLGPIEASKPKRSSLS